MTQHKTLADNRKEILEKHLKRTDTLSGVDLFFAYNEAMQEYAELYASQVVKFDCDYCEDRGWGGEHQSADLCPHCTGENKSQFIKKEVVSSDVEQAAKSHWGECATRVENEAMVLGFKLGAKWQSTQQPDTISFFSEIIKDAIDFGQENVFVTSVDKDIRVGEFIQSKLKERVNCVDPVEFATWCCVNGWESQNGLQWGQRDHEQGFLIKSSSQLLNEYLTSKTTPNGQAE